MRLVGAVGSGWLADHIGRNRPLRSVPTGVGIPLTPMLSLMVIGTPSSGLAIRRCATAPRTMQQKPYRHDHALRSFCPSVVRRLSH